jgi:hypothetical protein
MLARIETGGRRESRGSGSDEAAEAEGRMERREDRAPVRALDRKPVRIHGDVECPDRCAENQERRHERHDARCERRKKERAATGEQTDLGRPATAPAGGEPSGERHRDDCACCNAEERAAE